MSSFIARHKNDWSELEALIARTRKSRGKLTSAQRQRLDELYRRTTIHSARVSTIGSDPALEAYLNGLAAAAHTVIYLPPGEGIVAKLGKFLVEGFARAVARHWPQQLTSALLVIGGVLLGYFASTSDPLIAHALWPAEDVRQPGSTPDQLLSVLRGGRDQESGEKFLFASFLFQHNLKVSLLAMATGVLAAAPTVLLMVFNGMLLGVFIAIHYHAGITSEMWAWILPHGITEFGAIILCGGVGLMLGQAVVNPGQWSRNESLVRAGREAARICLGAAGMLVLAAIIESYVRQSDWSTEARLAFAAATFLFWAVYFGFGLVRERRERALREAGAAPMQERTSAGGSADIGVLPKLQPR
jgi:uncharacterized membrane protein SpoIIM required for sporulation